MSPPEDPDQPPLGFFFETRSLNLTAGFDTAFFFLEGILLLGSMTFLVGLSHSWRR
jgi:hypothetical protein